MCYGKTDPGVRRPNNEDAYYPTDHADDLGLFIVADGLGGHEAGEVASRLAVETAATVVREAARQDHPSDMLRRAVAAANLKVLDESQRNAATRGMATTLTALLLLPDAGHIAHVGDCRIYRWRQGEPLAQLTHDHSRIQTLLDQGLVTEEQAATHPWRHQLERALGLEPEVEIDGKSFPRVPGDRFLLCSDGLIRVISDDEIAQTLGSASPPSEQVETLVALARERDAPDNVTVIVVADEEEHR